MYSNTKDLTLRLDIFISWVESFSVSQNDETTDLINRHTFEFE